jgi:hypothetical protein
LTIDGNLVSKDYTSYTYNLQIKTDQFALINTPPDAKTSMKGLLSIGSDISLKGNGKDTEVKAKIIVQDTTHLIYVLTSSENDLLNTIASLILLILMTWIPPLLKPQKQLMIHWCESS